MKRIGLSVLLSILVLSGLSLAAQWGEQNESPSMPMMQEIRKGGKEGEDMGMMRMIKMMDQCSAMMESAKADSGEPQQGRKK